METVKLESPSIKVQHTDGNIYELADPIAFVVELSKSGLIDPSGNVQGGHTALETIREQIVKAFGFPGLTFSQVLQIIDAIKEFVDGFQKKTSLNQTSPNATGSSPRKMPGA